MKKINVLFVCMGNICRSPEAEGTFIHLVNARGLSDRFQIDSAGTSAYHVGEPANGQSRRAAAEFGISLESTSRQFSPLDFNKFDIILTMDESNYRDVVALASNDQHRAKVQMFRSYDPEASGRVEAPDVPDPYYGGADGFMHVQQIMNRTSAQLLEQLIRHYRLEEIS